MPLEFHNCYDEQLANKARIEQENKSWVPNAIQEIYHNVVDKKPTFPAGDGKCGAPPQFTEDGYRAIHTAILSNPEAKPLTIQVQGMPMEFHTKGNVRVDTMDDAAGKFVKDPGEVKPGVSKGHIEDRQTTLLTFKATNDQVVTVVAPDGFFIHDKRQY